MRYIYLSIALLFLPGIVNAYSGEDPAADVANKRSYMLQYQKHYQTASSKEEKNSKYLKCIFVVCLQEIYMHSVH